MPEEPKDPLLSIDKTLKEILTWTRFANITKLKETLENELESNQKKLAYENSDGIKGIKEIGLVSGASQDTVYSWWQKWFRTGLVVESETRKGRMKKIVSLEDVGIKTPRAIGSPAGRTAQAEVQEAGETASEVTTAATEVSK